MLVLFYLPRSEGESLLLRGQQIVVNNWWALEGEEM